MIQTETTHNTVEFKGFPKVEMKPCSNAWNGDVYTIVEKSQLARFSSSEERLVSNRGAVFIDEFRSTLKSFRYDLNALVMHTSAGSRLHAIFVNPVAPKFSKCKEFKPTDALFIMDMNRKRKIRKKGPDGMKMARSMLLGKLRSVK